MYPLIAALANKDLARTYTISPIGLTNNNPGGVIAFNNGADFGPDTPGPGPTGYTVTNGIQEALDALALNTSTGASGGTIVDIGGGTYQIYGRVTATGSNQTIIFNPGSSIFLNTQFPDGSPTSYPQGVFLICSDKVANNYSHIRWLGNGISVDTNTVGNKGNQGGPRTIFFIGDAPPGNPPNASADIILDGFMLKNVCPNGVIIEGGSGAGTNPTEAQSIRDVVLSNVSVTFSSLTDAGGSTAANCIFINGSCRRIIVEDFLGDQTAISTSLADGAVGIFIRSNAGSCQRIFVRRSMFSTVNSDFFEPLEIQGSVNASGVLTDFLTFEDCVFTNNFIFIDDDLDSSVLSYAGNVTFLRCRFECVIEWASMEGTDLAPYDTTLTIGGQPLGWPLMAERFLDCDLDSRQWSTFSTYSSGRPGFSNRAPPPWSGHTGGNVNSVDVSGLLSSPSAGGVLYTNGQYSASIGGQVEVFDEMLIVNGTGHNVASIQLDGNTTGLTSGVFLVRPGHTLTVTYGTGGGSAQVSLVPL